MRTSKLFSIALLMLCVLCGCKKGGNSTSDEPNDESQDNPVSGGEKCKASDYNWVTIGKQTWMAENYRCSKYDTESEAYKAGIKSVTTSEGTDFAPYYADATDKSKWDEDSKNKTGVKLTSDQISKLGYLYNWAAAVGVEDGQKQTKEFTGKRQGICPNGWHVPTKAEWQTLEDYIEKTDGKGTKTTGKHLKTTSGWYEDNSFKPGSNTYGFSALPAGSAKGSQLFEFGTFTYHWTATPYSGDGANAYFRSLTYHYDYQINYYYLKDAAISVRCLKD